MSQQRDAVSGPTLSPPWLCAYGSNGQRYMYTVGVGCDILLEKLNQAQQAKFPGHGGPTALPLQAADRLMVQGTLETDDQLSARLQQAFATWQLAGSRRAVLSQIQAYMTGTLVGVDTALPTALIVGGDDTLTTWDTLYGYMSQGAPPSHITAPINWDWDGNFYPWRVWLVVFMALNDVGLSGSAASIPAPAINGFVTITGLSGITTDQVQQYITISGAANADNNGTFQITHVVSATVLVCANPLGDTDANNGSLVWEIGSFPYIGPAPVWGADDSVWGSGHAWGLNVSQQVVISMRDIVKRWKGAGTYYESLIISFATTVEMTPDAFALGGANPTTGLWGYPAVANTVGVMTYQRALSGAATLGTFDAFCRGSGIPINCYKDTKT